MIRVPARGLSDAADGLGSISAYAGFLTIDDDLRRLLAAFSGASDAGPLVGTFALAPRRQFVECNLVKLAGLGGVRLCFVADEPEMAERPLVRALAERPYFRLYGAAAKGAEHGGAMLPLGSTLELSSHKGYALSLMVDTLCNLLTGMATGPERARQTGPGRPGMGHFLGALSIERFQPLNEFKRRMDENLRLLRSSARMEGCERIYTPGEREWLCEQERRAGGIPVHETTRAALAALAGELGLELPPAV